MTVGLSMMAWREILARVFDGFARQEDVTPDWLVNPSTRRRLKLDVWYPEIGIAIRFVGLQGKRKGPISDEELLEEEQRDEIRAELCRQHGVYLVPISVLSERPGEALRALSAALGQATRRMAQGDREPSEKLRLMPLLAKARRACEELIQRVHRQEDLALYAELWRDRETAMITSLQSQPTGGPGKVKYANALKYAEGMAVRHITFGPGTITAIVPEGDDARITVRFVTAGERTFLASLVTDKLIPAGEGG
ncbi:MAG: hypothetical protein RML36_02190 [Anaerolineae bacterium]|nr:hypothetical protein [Anaerolineae bacterium]MDW8098277.1 hypothetical protein [Anaerolineae bacterium]